MLLYNRNRNPTFLNQDCTCENKTLVLKSIFLSKSFSSSINCHGIYIFLPIKFETPMIAIIKFIKMFLLNSYKVTLFVKLKRVEICDTRDTYCLQKLIKTG